MTMNTGGDIFARARTDREVDDHMLAALGCMAVIVFQSIWRTSNIHHRFIVHDRRIFRHCFVDRHYRLKHFIFNVDELQCFERNFFTFCDDRSNAIADVTHFLTEHTAVKR